MRIFKLFAIHLYLILCFVISCGGGKESKINNDGGAVSMGGSGDAGLYSTGQGGLILNLGGQSDYDAGVEMGGAPVYMLPSDFTKGKFGGYKLGSEYTGNMGDSGGMSSECGTQILGIVRDFRGNNEVNGHPDFEHFFGNTPSLGIVKEDLGIDQKPIYSGSGPIIDPNNNQQTTSKEYFDEWYRNIDGVNGPYIVYFYFEPNGNILSFESTAFFPLDKAGFGNTPGQMHNFAFTTEVHTKFDYKGGEVFSFIGDDDVWVFINNKLAIDLGGLHSKQTKSISLDVVAKDLNIEVGKNYNLDLFHAERHTIESNFRIDTNLSFTNCGTIVDGPLK